MACEICSAGKSPKISADPIAAAVAENKDPPVEIEIQPERQLDRHGMQEKRLVPHGDQQAQGASEHADDEAFREHLAHDATAGGAECEANGDLMRARSGPREHEVGDVGAGDQQDEYDRTERELHQKGKVLGGFFADGPRDESDAVIGLGVSGCDARGDGCELGVDLVETDTGL